jgi:hypothetical protein
MTSTLEKPYVTARQASQALGVPIERIVADIDAGMDGALPSLIGMPLQGVYYLPRWEVEGERLEMHRARLSVEAGVAVGSQGATSSRESVAP